jgi:hypothetical protein
MKPGMHILSRGAAPETRPSGRARELDELITRIVESDTFRAAPMMRTLLPYRWKHQDDSVSEYAIAGDALEQRILIPSQTPRCEFWLRVSERS